MNRQELLYNLDISREKHETVTLWLYPLAGKDQRTVVIGKVVAIGGHYSATQTTLAVVERADTSAILCVNLGMIADFRVGRPRPTLVTT